MHTIAQPKLLPLALLLTATLTAPASAHAGEGKIDAKTVEKIVKAHFPEVRYCYHNIGLAKDPKLTGSVTARFTVGVDGRVKKSEISAATIADPELQACVANAVARWIFPKPRGGEAVLEVPFAFAPGV